MLTIFNSAHKQKEVFQPIEAGKIKLYVCGMTVYDYCHLGHARVLVSFDVIVRYLRVSGWDVTYVRNITDVDDKIIQRAQDNGESIGQLTTRFIQAMHEDAEALNVLPPDQEPKATEAMAEIIQMITTLIDKGFAYVGGNGDVFFEVSQFAAYGRLSGKDLAALNVGERVQAGIVAAKRQHLDFVLWKLAKPGEPSWSSPWGQGRPGWHIECSAMSTQYLGNHFDIHGGGADLQFPHHENELAQSECATGETFVNYWMHNGFVNIDEEKMSKSTGNFSTVREVLTHYKGEDIRYFVLSSQYRSPLNYSDEAMAHANAALTRLYTALRGIEPGTLQCSTFTHRFHQAMEDDFNTAEALAVMFDLAKEINRIKATELAQAAVLAAELKSLGHMLGILQASPEAYLQSAGGDEKDTLSNEAIEALVVARTQARQNKDWAESDKIRDDLVAHGIVLEDGAAGTIWRRQ